MAHETTVRTLVHAKSMFTWSWYLYNTCTNILCLTKYGQWCDHRHYIYIDEWIRLQEQGDHIIDPIIDCSYIIWNVTTEGNKSFVGTAIHYSYYVLWNDTIACSENEILKLEQFCVIWLDTGCCAPYPTQCLESQYTPISHSRALPENPNQINRLRKKIIKKRTS